MARFRVEFAIFFTYLIGGFAPDLYVLFQIFLIKQFGSQAVIEVMAIVGDFISEVGHLRLERTGFGIKVFTFTRMIIGSVMLCQALTGFPGKIQAIVMGVFLLQRFDDAQTLAVVFKSAVILHKIIQRMFALVAERRMTEVMSQSDCFSEVFIEAQSPGDVP